MNPALRKFRRAGFLLALGKWAVGTNLPFACTGEHCKSLPLGGKVARYAPDEGEMSGRRPLISHLR